jgi:glycosyltransferase involved in cell wall biosynthesis
MNAPSVLDLVHPEMMAGCTAWRVVWPMTEMVRRGLRVGWGPVGDRATSSAIDRVDAVVAARLEWAAGSESDALRWRDVLHGNGKALIYETDDDLYSEQSVGRVRETGQVDHKDDQVLEIERQARIFALSVADGVTVSTERLADVVQRFTDKPVRIVPNAIDLPRFQAAMTSYGPIDRDRPPTIGWAGGNRPDRDALDLAIAWGRVADRYPDVRFVVGGYPLRALIDSVPEDRLTVVPKRTIDTYPATLALMDIGCCPLADEPFNWAKSPIKALEMGAAGCAVVASATVYDDLIDHGQDGLIAGDGPDDWDAHLSALIENPDRRRDLAQALLRTIRRDHSLAGNVHRWPAAWSDLVADFRLRALRGSLGPARHANTAWEGCDA